MEEKRLKKAWTKEVDTGQKKAKRKRRTGLLAGLLALLVLMTGSFAWFYVTNAINEFGGKRDEPNSAVLHDDFDEEGIVNELDDVVHNKDIFAENTGGNDIFVRIRLDEYMEIDGTSVISGSKKTEENTWKPHRPHDDETDDCDDVFHYYWEWQMGGDAVEYIPNATGSNGVVSRYDSNGNDTLVPGAGVNKWTHKGAGTSTEVITMTAYAALSDTEQSGFEGWIMDSDGYAYWYQKLEPGAATGLLLDQVTLIRAFPDGSEYYYAINVIMETVDEEDLDAWLNGTMTKDGSSTPAKVTTTAMANYLKEISSSYQRVEELRLDTDDPDAPDPEDYDHDGDGYLSGEERQEYEADAAKYTTVVKLEIIAGPSQTTYIYGDSFDRDDIEVTATFEWKDRTEIITDFEVTPEILQPEEQGEKSENVTQTVTISYGAASTTLDVVVENPRTGLYLDTEKVQTTFAKGDTFNYDELIVYAIWQSGYREEVTPDSVSGEDMGSAGLQTISVAYEQDIETYEIIVGSTEEIFDEAVPGDIIPIGDSRWILLDADKTAGTAEIWSRDLVANMPYHRRDTSWQWSDSTVREYLNGTYFNVELDKEVKAMAEAAGKRTNPTNLPGEDLTSAADTTEDYVYLLSYEEFYAISSRYGGNLDFSVDGPYPVTYTWWLRSPSQINPDRAVTVNYQGQSLYTTGINVTSNRGVRPALTIKYK